MTQSRSVRFARAGVLVGLALLLLAPCALAQGDSSSTRTLTLEGHEKAVLCCGFSPDGRHFATGSYDYKVHIWDAESGEKVHTLEGHTYGVTGLAFSPNGRQIATGSYDGTLRIWDLRRGTEVECLMAGGNNDHVILDVAWRPDGRKIATCGKDKTVRIWDLETKAVEQTLRGHAKVVQSVCYAADARWIASGGGSGRIRLSSSDGTHIGNLAGHRDFVNGLASSPDSTQLASASADSTVRIWDIREGKAVHVLRGHRGAVWGVAFSPDGSRLASVGWDRTVKIWDVAQGRQISSFDGEVDWVYDVAYASDGKLGWCGWNWDGKIRSASND